MITLTDNAATKVGALLADEDAEQFAALWEEAPMKTKMASHCA